MGQRTYKDAALEVIEGHHKQKGEALTQKELVLQVLKKLGLDTSLENQTKKQPNVSKALKNLVLEKKVTRTDEGGYIPFSTDNVDGKAKDLICRTVVFTSEEVFRMSDNTLLVSVDANSHFDALKLFKWYLGVVNCFDVVSFNGYIMLLLRGNQEKLNALYKEVEGTVKKAIKRYKMAAGEPLKLPRK